MKSPKAVYLYAKSNNSRFEEGEKILIRPYNFKLRKFITKKSEYHDNMFMWAIAYLRNVLKRSPQIIKEDYQKKLEKQLIKHFDPWSIFNYASAIDKRLPDELHNRVIMEAMSGDVWLKRYLNRYGGNIKLRKFVGTMLSKPKEIHNYLVDFPSATDEEIMKALWKKGIIINKLMIEKVRNKNFV